MKPSPPKTLLRIVFGATLTMSWKVARGEDGYKTKRPSCFSSMGFCVGQILTKQVTFSPKSNRKQTRLNNLQLGGPPVIFSRYVGYHTPHTKSHAEKTITTRGVQTNTYQIPTAWASRETGAGASVLRPAIGSHPGTYTKNGSST